MTKLVDVHHAKTHFLKLIERVSRGEEITIARAGKPEHCLKQRFFPDTSPRGSSPSPAGGRGSG